jgi:hypothetical protein
MLNKKSSPNISLSHFIELELPQVNQGFHTVIEIVFSFWFAYFQKTPLYNSYYFLLLVIKKNFYLNTNNSFL